VKYFTNEVLLGDGDCPRCGQNNNVQQHSLFRCSYKVKLEDYVRFQVYVQTSTALHSVAVGNTPKKSMEVQFSSPADVTASSPYPRIEMPIRLLVHC